MVETVRERIPDGAEEGASYYPVFLDVRGRTALVVGGGAVAERKAAGLARAGACVRVVAPTVTAGLEAQARDGLVDLRRRAFAKTTSRALPGRARAFESWRRRSRRAWRRRRATASSI